MMDFFENIETLGQLINALNAIKDKYGSDTKIVGSSNINMGVGDNGFNEFETNYNLNVSVFYDQYNKSVDIGVDGKCDFLQEKDII